MSTFTFADKNILDSHLLPNHGSRYLTIHTSYGLLLRKETTVTQSPSAYAHDSVLGGSINWKNETFEIGGVVRRVKELKHSAGLFSSAREWRWSGRQYVLKYSGNQWTAKCGTVGASMKPYQSHIIRKSEPASISFPSDLSREDMIFLFLVFIYSETKRQDGIGSHNGAVAAAAASASAPSS